MIPKNFVSQVKNRNLLQYYKPMLIILFFSGYNLNVFSNKLIFQICAMFYHTFLIVLIAYATVTCCEASTISPYWSLLEYTCTVVIYFLYKSRIKPFFDKVATIDIKLRISYKYYHRNRVQMFLFIVVVWAVRIAYSVYFCFIVSCYNEFALFLISQFSPMALDLNRVWRFTVFNIVRYRLKVLRKRLLELPDSNSYLYVSNNKAMKEKKIAFCMFLYKNIADTMDIVIPELHSSVSFYRIYFNLLMFFGGLLGPL